MDESEDKCKNCPFEKLQRTNKYCQLCIKSNVNGFVTIDGVLKKCNWKEEILKNRKE